MAKKTRKMRLTNGEKLLYTTGLISFVLVVFVKVFFSAGISTLQMNIEKITYKIENQEKKNKSLVMQVNELTSYENLNGVLKDMGLEYNNENIVVVK